MSATPSQQRQLQHLYHRAAFGISLAEMRTKITQNRSQWVEELFKEANNYTPINEVDEFTSRAEARQEFLQMTPEQRKEAIKKALKEGRERIKRINEVWLTRMYSNTAALRERMTLFWHGHFACQFKDAFLAQEQINIIRQNALGKLKDLMMAVAKNPAMILFLNNQQNKKAHPNENFARELMELFTIGRGNYTEQDIKEAARAFTGWAINKDTGKYQFNEKTHDFDPKTFMGKTGNFNGDEIIDIILEQPQTALYITKKIYQYFVKDDITQKNHQTRIEQLAKTFKQNSYDIGALMKQIFMADWFYEEENIGSKIKSPVDLMMSLQKHFNLQYLDHSAPMFIQKVLGQMILYPPNVAGWAGGRAWIDSNTLLFRLQLPEFLLKAAELNVSAKDDGDVNNDGLVNNKLKKLQVSNDWSVLLTHFKAIENPETRFAKMTEYLLQTTQQPDWTTMKTFLDISSDETHIQSLALAIASLPEYQMC
ncbi:MAG: DUF1800 domain-containing protein [Cytophagales bacterium]|nr:MAG: DUF1800 domain-containing protein [Cytophagales bacterium]